MVVAAPQAQRNSGSPFPSLRGKDRGDGTPDNLLVMLAASSIVLLRLPTLYGGNAARVVVLLPLVFALVWMAPAAQVRGRSLTAILTGLFLTCLAIALARGTRDQVNSSAVSAAGDILNYSLVATLGYTLITSAPDRRQRERRLTAICLAPGIYCVANLALHFAGFSPVQAASVALGGQAELLSTVGISATRVQFPLSNSINNFGVVAAAGFAAALLLAVRATGIRLRVTAGVVSLLSLYCLALSDTRGALITAILVTVLVGARWVKRWYLAAIAIPFMPLIVISGLSIVGASSASSSLSRSAGDVSSGNGRLDIWRGAWETIRVPHVEWLIGYGAGGQITSGASLNYAYIFNGQPDPVGAHTHNLAIQTVLDTGYIGLALLVSVLVCALVQLARRFRSRESWPAAAALTIIVVITLSGATEVTPTYIARDALLVSLLVIGAAAGLGAADVGTRKPR